MSPAGEQEHGTVPDAEGSASAAGRRPPRPRHQTLMIVVFIVAIALIILSAFGSAFIRTYIFPEVDKGEKVPAFTVTSFDNETLAIRQYEGSVVILQMFATWCHPCLLEVELLQELLPSYPKEKIVVLSVDIDATETEAQLRDYAATHNVTWPMALDTDDIASRYGVVALPTLMIIDQQQRLVHSFTGVTTEKAVRQVLDPICCE